MMAVPTPLSRTPPRSTPGQLQLYWPLVGHLVSADLRGRYAGSVFGLAWSVLHPLALIAILTLVFSGVMRARLPASADPYAYSIFLCAGLLPWIAVQEIVTRCTTVFVDRSQLIKQVAFPPAALHLSLLGSAAVNLGVMVVVLLVFLGCVGHRLGWETVLWPILLASQLLFATGLGLITSVLHVFLRDTAQLVAVGLQLWFWLTPIVYPASIVPERAARLLHFNPLFVFTRAQQELLLTGAWPSGATTLLLAGLSIGALGAGALLLQAVRHRLPDEL